MKAKHATTSDTLSITCISKCKTMGVKDSHYFVYQLDSIHSSKLVHPLIVIDVLHKKLGIVDIEQQIRRDGIHRCTTQTDTGGHDSPLFDKLL